METLYGIKVETWTSDGLPQVHVSKNRGTGRWSGSLAAALDDALQAHDPPYGPTPISARDHKSLEKIAAAYEAAGLF